LLRLSGRGPLDGIGMTMEVADAEAVDAEVADAAVRLELMAEGEEVPRRPVSPMVETIAEVQNSRAAILLGVAQ
jgi:hypothetical protein